MLIVYASVDMVQGYYVNANVFNPSMVGNFAQCPGLQTALKWPLKY